MSNWDLGVVTDAGVTILNKIEAGLASAVIDTIVIGSGVYSTSEKALISRRTALKNQQLSATINATRFPDSSTLEIKASIDNTTVVSGFDITECGVYATVTEGGVTSTALFAVAYTETPDYMTAYNGEYPQIVIEDVYLPISNTASITVTVAPGAYALAEDLTDHEAEKATTADYGHTKIIDALTSASYADGEALAAHQGNVIKIELDKAYKSDDSASTDLVDGDYIPFYDTSATTKKKALWSTIIAKLKNIFPMGSTLAPIANGPKYPGTWSAGKQFVYQGQLYKTKVNVTSSDNINVGTGGNAELASDISSQISTLDNYLTPGETSVYKRIYFDVSASYTTGNTYRGILKPLAEKLLQAAQSLNAGEYIEPIDLIIGNLALRSSRRTLYTSAATTINLNFTCTYCNATNLYCHTVTVVDSDATSCTYYRTALSSGGATFDNYSANNFPESGTAYIRYVVYKSR